MRTVDDIFSRNTRLRPRLANELESFGITSRDEVRSGVAVLVLDTAPPLTRQRPAQRAGDSLGVRARLEQAVYYFLAQLQIVEAHSEVEGRRTFQAVDRVDITFFVFKDVLEYDGADVRGSAGIV